MPASSLIHLTVYQSVAPLLYLPICLAEWFETWLGHPYMVDIISPPPLPGWDRIKVATKILFGRIPNVPLCSARPSWSHLWLAKGNGHPFFLAHGIYVSVSQ